jgi:hypothetical protein
MHKNKKRSLKTITILLHEPYSNINKLVNALKTTPVMTQHNAYSDNVNEPADIMSIEPEEIFELHEKCPDAILQVYILTDAPSLNLERMRHARPGLSEGELYDAYLDLHSHYFARVMDVYRRINSLVKNDYDFITHAYDLIPATHIVELDMSLARQNGYDMDSVVNRLGTRHHNLCLDMDVIEGAFREHSFRTSDGRRSIVVETSGYVPALPLPHNILAYLMASEKNGAREIVYKAFAAIVLGYNDSGLPSLDLRNLQVKRPMDADEDKALVERSREAIKQLTGKDVI